MENTIECSRCLGTGTYPANHTPEDTDWEPCDCGNPVMDKAEEAWVTRYSGPDWANEPSEE